MPERTEHEERARDIFASHFEEAYTEAFMRAPPAPRGDDLVEQARARASAFRELGRYTAANLLEALANRIEHYRIRLGE